MNAPHLSRTLALSVLFASLVAPAHAAPPPPKGKGISVALAELTDKRRSDGTFARLEVELKLEGGGLEGVKGARAIPKKALDDTGRSLLSTEEKVPDFDTSFGRGSEPRLTLRLKNPARKAAVVKEISGDLELFAPGRDPNAVVKVDKFLSKADRPIASPALKAASVEVTIITKKGYEAEKKKEAERRKKEAEKQGIAGAMVEAMGEMLSGLMGDVSENDVVLKVEDKGKKVFSFEVVDASGKPLEGRGSMSQGSFKVLSFGEKPPEDAGLRIYLKTAKALVTQPFALKDVALP